MVRKISSKECYKIINAIKSHYRFKNAPKLNLQIVHNRVAEILNDEVLFYYMQFLSNAGQFFSNEIVKPIRIFNSYNKCNKVYYRKHFPELFKTDCFNFLCELSDEILPIIPIPEHVINNSGIEQIEDSFLFPIVNRKNIYWIWESVEESKASYLFLTLAIDFELQLQTIFDYLTGDTINKRHTLISSSKLKTELCLKKRIMHSDLNNWMKEIKSSV